MFIIGIILNKKRAFKYVECSESPNNYFKKPYIMNEEPVYPGCTRADIIITSLLFRLPTFIRGILRPS
jgi:hypothetical protein